MAKMKNEVVEAKGPTGKRYTSEQKQEIADFIRSKEGERGAISEAMRKFGVSYILINSILNNPEFSGKGKPGRKSKTPSTPSQKVENAKPGRKPTNAVFIRTLLKIRKDYEKMGSKLATMEGLYK